MISVEAIDFMPKLIEYWLDVTLAEKTYSSGVGSKLSDYMRQQNDRPELGDASFFGKLFTCFIYFSITESAKNKVFVI